MLLTCSLRLRRRSWCRSLICQVGTLKMGKKKRGMSKQASQAIDGARKPPRPPHPPTHLDVGLHEVAQVGLGGRLRLHQAALRLGEAGQDSSGGCVSSGVRACEAVCAAGSAGGRGLLVGSNDRPSLLLKARPRPAHTYTHTCAGPEAGEAAALDHDGPVQRRHALCALDACMPWFATGEVSNREDRGRTMRPSF